MNIKNITILKAIIICILVLATTLAYSGNGNKNKKQKKDIDTSFCLQVSGRLHGNHSKKDDVYKIELVHQNNVVDVLRLKDRKSFKFDLKPNVHYAIRISKNGWFPTLISVNTDLPCEIEKGKVFKFHFDSELIDEDHKDSVNVHALDYPIAVVSYDKEMDNFHYSERYTENIIDEIHEKKHHKHHGHKDEHAAVSKD